MSVYNKSVGLNFEFPSDVVLRTRWYIYLRWFLLLAIAIPGLIPLYLGEGWSAQVQRDTTLAILAVGSNGAFWLLGRVNRSVRYYALLAVILMILDVLLITYFIYTKGGIESRSPILYVVPILMSAAIFGRKAVYITAGGALIAYDFFIIIEHFGLVQGLGSFTNLRSDTAYVANTILFFSAIFFIVAFLADYITRQLTLKERQALEGAEALKRAQAIARLGSWEWDITRDKIIWSEELCRLFSVSKKRGGLPSYQMYLKRIHPDDREFANKFTHVDFLHV